MIFIGDLNCPGCNEPNPIVENMVHDFNGSEGTCVQCGTRFSWEGNPNAIVIQLPDDIRPDQLYGEPV
jgi:hypothetical protein